MNDIAGGELLFSEKKSRLPTVLLYAVIFLLVGLTLFYFFITYSQIRGSSMENTMFDGSSVVLQRRGYSLERGDIVTIDMSEKRDYSHNIVKRVIGLSGDRILFVRSNDMKSVDLYVCKNGETRLSALDEPYIKEPMRAAVSYGEIALMQYVSEDELTSIELDAENSDPRKESIRKNVLNCCTTVPTSQFFFLGDNRNDSSDSRYYGTQPTDRIIGKVIMIIDAGSGMEKLMCFLFGVR